MQAVLEDAAVALERTEDVNGRLVVVEAVLKRLSNALGKDVDLVSAIVRLAQTVTASLELPTRFSDDGWPDDPDRALLEAQWRAYGASATALLHALLELLQPVGVQQTDLPHELFIACARFVGDEADPWITPLSSRQGARCLDLLTASSPAALLIQRVLADYLRPLFLSRPHISINAASGRVLARPRGGPGYTDFSSPQHWKGGVKGALGSWNVLSACLRCLKLSELEEMWHLVVPPLMTILDDHEIPFRMRGIRCMLVLLDVADQSLLKRTGLDRLLLQSLTTSLSFLSFPEHAPLIGMTLPAYLVVVDKMHPASDELTEQRFDALCALMRDGPLSIWTYAMEKPAFVGHCVSFLPELCRALGICSVRFLDKLIPPLCYILRFPALTAELHASTALALTELLRVVGLSGKLVAKWRGTVLAAVVMCAEQASDPEEKLAQALAGVVVAVRKACPTIIEASEHFPWRLSLINAQADLARLRKDASGSTALQALFIAA